MIVHALVVVRVGSQVQIVIQYHGPVKMVVRPWEGVVHANPKVNPPKAHAMTNPANIIFVALLIEICPSLVRAKDLAAFTESDCCMACLRQRAGARSLVR